MMTDTQNLTFLQTVSDSTEDTTSCILEIIDLQMQNLFF